MLNEMVFETDDFGVINQSKIELNQINVVTGVNSSGKSTLSKLLYSFLISLSKEGDFLASKSITKRLDPLIMAFKMINIFEKNSSVYRELDSLLKFCYKGDYNHVFDSLNRIYVENKDRFEDEEWINLSLESIKNTISLNESNESTRKYDSIMNVLLNSEFKLHQIEQNSKIRFKGNSFDYILKLSKHKLKGTLKEGSLNSSILNQIIYVDSDILNIDKFTTPIPFHIQDFFKRILYKKEIDVYGDEFSKNILNIKNELQELIKGNVEFDSDQDEFVYRTENYKYPMSSSTASGIKQIGIFQMLLDILKMNSFVFIDEPEGNLHPEWQLKLAEFIVLLSKKLNITFYINSHSPFFIEAIETYSKHYDMDKKTSFYLSEKTEDEKFNINKIEADEIYKIYENLGKSFNSLNTIRFEDMGL